MPALALEWDNETQAMSKNYPFTLNEQLSLRDPERTLLGKKIVECAITLMDQQGFEHLTFRKLAAEIPSTEASVYRYFEDKYQLLRYLVAWYWEWLNYRLEQKDQIAPRQSLREALDMLANSARYDPFFAHVDEAALCRIVVRESPKIYLTSDPQDNQALFIGYEKLLARISAIIEALQPGYPHPKALVSSLIETAHRQILFAQYMPRLTELQIQDGDYSEIASFLETMALAMLRAHRSQT
jgi:AcrR family transcriptional regulator